VSAAHFERDRLGADQRFGLFLLLLDKGEDMSGTDYVSEEGTLKEIEGMSPELDKALIRKTVAEAQIAEAKAQEAKLQLNNIEATNDANRVLIIDGPILDLGDGGGVSMNECSQVLMRWSRRDPGKDITIYMNTQGGSVFDGNTFIHTIQQLQAKGHKVTIYGHGCVMSLGAVILQAADERVLAKDTVFMIHSQSGVVGGSTEDREDQEKMLKGVQERHLTFLAERSTMSLRQLKTKTRRKDWYLSAQEALQYGFCDRVE
jgi:ATP-dependent Clp protease protease subunit